jgi:HemY protein
MRLILFSIIALLGAIYLGLELQQDPGHVSIQIRDFNREWTVPWAIAGAIVGFVTFYFAVRILGGVLRTPKWLRSLSQRRARRALNNGLVQLAEGDWSRAMKNLSRATNSQETAMLGYLASARAAQGLGNAQRRNHLLQLAQQIQPNAEVAVGVTQAQLLIENQELETAAQLLRKLHAEDRDNKLVLELLKECYLLSHSWEDLAHIIPALEKAKVIRSEESTAMARHAYSQLLAKAAATGDDTRALDAMWREVPHSLRREAGILAQYVRYLMEHGEGPRPESMLRGKLKSKWNDELGYLYGLVTGTSAAQQLQAAEGWIKRQPDNATLFLTLGRLALRNHLWSKARSYLERSAELEPNPETYMLLGKLLEQSGDKIIAGECFRKGLGITVNKNALLLERSPIESPTAALTTNNVPSTALATGSPA